MKKLIAFILILTVIVSLVACTSNNDEISEESSTVVETTQEPESAVEEDDDIEEVEATEEPEESEEASVHIEEESLLPEITTGSDAFITAFTDNDIDTTYIDDMTFAASITAMVEANTTATESWERDISFAYTMLMGLADEEDTATIELEQSAWLNDLPIITNEIQSDVSDSGSMGKVDAAYQIMIIYRERAAIIHAQIFEITGTVEFAPAETDVVG